MRIASDKKYEWEQDIVNKYHTNKVQVGHGLKQPGLKNLVKNISFETSAMEFYSTIWSTSVNRVTKMEKQLT